MSHLDEVRLQHVAVLVEERVGVVVDGPGVVVHVEHHGVLGLAPEPRVVLQLQDELLRQRGVGRLGEHRLLVQDGQDAVGPALDQVQADLVVLERHLQPMQRCESLTFGISGGRSLTRPLPAARRFPSTRLYSEPGATRTMLGFGICPSFKGHFLSRRAKP
jgi:hypothetical protein